MPVIALLVAHCGTTMPVSDASPDGVGRTDVSADRAAPPFDAVIDAVLDTAPDADTDAATDADSRLDAMDVAPVGVDRVDVDVAVSVDRVVVDTPPPPPCTTRITYGNTWIRGAGHPADYDDIIGAVTWDGVCTDDGTNSYAVLSNGWRPYFTGRGACVIALDYAASCPSVPSSCATRVTYGTSWAHGPGHAAQYDDTADAVSWDGVCHPSGAQSYAVLSNGWRPYFDGSNNCGFSMRYTQCGGLYDNAVVATDCPDPGVVRDGATYVMVCTGGGGGGLYPIRTSTDLVHWTLRGAIFPAGREPAWATGDFWAPEIHHVGTHWVAYFSARNRGDNSLAIGAASGPSATGPFTDIGRPLIDDPRPGVIDVSQYQAPDGTRYLLWKTDGNQTGAPTPIHIQRLASDGLSLTGSATTLITNDQSWEAGLVEGPWMINEGGMYYLFYSANGYASPSYAIGVARSASPLGPFVKAPGPILVSKGAWAGPGHGSVVRAPGGEWVHVYHAWVAGRIGSAPGRQVLVDRIEWAGGWPRMLGAPSSRSQPLP